MAVGMWRGVNNVARKIKKRYRGVNNVTRTVKKRWRGVGNVARLTFQDDLVLYDNGTEYVAFSDVGDEVDYSYGSVTFRNTSIDFDTCYGWFLYTTEIIDYSSYNTVNVELTVDEMSTETDYIVIGVRDGFTSDTGATFSTTKYGVETELGTPLVISVDISEITAKGGLYLMLQGSNAITGSSSSTYKLTGSIHKIWLE